MATPLLLASISVTTTLDRVPPCEPRLWSLPLLEATRARQRAMEALARGDLEDARASILYAAPMVAEHGPALAAEADELEDALRQIEQSPARARKTLSSQVYRNRKGGKGP